MSYVQPFQEGADWNIGEGPVPKPADAEEHEQRTGHLVHAFHVGATLEVDWQCTSMLSPFKSCRACKADPTYGEEASAR